MFNPFETSEQSQERPPISTQERAALRAPQTDDLSQSVVVRQINERKEEESNRPKYLSRKEQEDEASLKLARVFDRTISGLNGGRWVVPETVIEKSQRVLDARMDDEKLNLKVEQLEMVKNVERAILAGDFHTLQKLVKAGKVDPSVARTISKDLASIGMNFDWSENSMNIRSERENNHPQLRIRIDPERKHSNASLEWSVVDSKPGQPLHVKFEERPLMRTDDALWEVALTAHARLQGKSK